jgi:hypothetical protein
MTRQTDLQYDPSKNIVFTEDTWEIKTNLDVDVFFSYYYAFFEKLGKRTYMISHIDNLLVHAEASDYYSKVARDFTLRWIIGFARWGTNSWARMTVRTTALKARMAPCIYSTREEAIRSVAIHSHTIPAVEPQPARKAAARPLLLRTATH